MYVPPLGDSVDFNLPSVSTSGPVVNKRPLALYDGRVKELQEGDSLYGFLKVWSIVIADTPLEDGDRVLANTTVDPLLMSLPSAPSFGEIVAIKDYAKTFAINNCTIDRNGEKIDGVAADLVLNVNGQAIELTFSGAAQGLLTTSKV
jgi:hypothetical protein